MCYVLSTALTPEASSFIHEFTPQVLLEHLVGAIYQVIYVPNCMFPIPH